MKPRLCARPPAGRHQRHGVATCGACGVRRFRDYAALRWPGRGQLDVPPRAGPTARATGPLLLRP
ncbi:DUF6255 family natural product biosynthesis protein [Streptomyces cinnamoneus]|uniref:DUF6255 family natural product biosynthesis protein n=1 Tax=Streptomyces cinnamoneus TaxID=53446 RepID=UPI0035713448